MSDRRRRWFAFVLAATGELLCWGQRPLVGLPASVKTVELDVAPDWTRHRWDPRRCALVPA